MKRTLVLNKKGCSCCVKKISSAFDQIDGVKNFEFQAEEGKMSFEILDYNSMTQVQSALVELGYPAESIDLANRIESQLGCRLKLIHA